MVAATRMIFSRLFEEIPDLTLVLLHGGGYLPSYCSRADHTWKVPPRDSGGEFPTMRPAIT